MAQPSPSTTRAVRAAADPHAPLRDDIRRLGAILGETVAERSGQATFDTVEAVRKAAKAARAGDIEAARELSQRLARLSIDEAVDVARAFAHFLTLANIAEQHHRVRRRRDHQRDAAAPPQRGSLAEAFGRLRGAGITPKQLRDAVLGMRIELVLTAHPTEITRRTLLAKHQRVASILETLDRPDLTAEEREEHDGALRREVLAMWQTPEFRTERPTPEDEARGGFAVIEHVLWDALPVHLRALDRSLREHTGHGLPIDAAPIRFGSWMGGDRDGNPNVRPQTTRRVVLLARWMAAHLVRHEVDEIRGELSMADATEEVRRLAGDDPEPYRAVLRDVRDRLAATTQAIEARLRGEEPGTAATYDDTAPLSATLQMLYRSLHDTGSGRVADGRLRDLLWRLGCFGLALVRLDIRQEADRHTAAVAAWADAHGLGDYDAMDEAARVAFLTRHLQAAKAHGVPQKMDADEQDVFDTLSVVAGLPRESLGAYVVSMASTPSDVLAVHLLQRIAGVTAPLPVVPLFETLDDLEGAPAAVAALLDSDAVRRRLDDGLVVMVGYSDSAKDAGKLAAAWALYRAQEGMAQAARRHGTRLTVFHGRGGSVSRGGGPAHAAIAALPPGTVGGRIRITEQGEVIQAHYGQPGIALRTFELYTSGVLEATLAPPAAPRPEWRAMMDRLSDESCRIFRSVRDDDAFVQYFRAATPEPELGLLNIGSRPARRKADGSVASLRAIPWVFAWTQNRLLLPAWLGVGETLAAAWDEDGGKRLSEMRAGWPFFAALLDVIEMVLAKGDPHIAQHYEEVLVGPRLRPIGEDLRRRFRAAVATFRTVLGHAELLDGNPVLQRSIRVRNPYVDPLNLLQVEYLRRLRQEKDPAIERALLVTMNGVAQGMRNTG